MNIQFWQTVMGKTFYDRTMPELVRELHRLNNNLERLLVTCWQERLTESQKPKEEL